MAATSRCSTRCTTWRRWRDGRRRWITRRCCANWLLPESFARLRQALETRHGPTAGARQYIRVLQLLAEHPLERVQAAVETCLRRDELHAERIGAEVRRLHGRRRRHASDTPMSIPGSAARFGLLRPTSVPRRIVTMADNKHMLLRANLKQLKLPAMGAEFEKLAREAAEANEDYEQYLLRLTELEVAARASNAVQARIRAAGFPVAKDFDTFDFTAVPSLSKPKVLELARGEWIEQRTNTCFIGSPGTGKPQPT